MTVRNVDGIAYSMMADEEDTELNCLFDTLVFGEALCISIKLPPIGLNTFNENLRRIARHGKMSVVARDTSMNDKIVATLVVSVNRKNGPNAVTIPFLDDPVDDGIKMIFKILEDCKKGIDLFEYFGEDQYIKYEISLVLEGYRGRRIVGNMKSIANDAARARCINCVGSETTGEASYRANARLGMKTISETLYEDFKIDGEVVFKNMGVSDRCRFMVMKLD